MYTLNEIILNILTRYQARLNGSQQNSAKLKLINRAINDELVALFQLWQQQKLQANNSNNNVSNNDNVQRDFIDAFNLLTTKIQDKKLKLDLSLAYQTLSSLITDKDKIKSVITSKQAPIAYSKSMVFFVAFLYLGIDGLLQNPALFKLSKEDRQKVFVLMQEHVEQFQDKDMLVIFQFLFKQESRDLKEQKMVAKQLCATKQWTLLAILLTEKYFDEDALIKMAPKNNSFDMEASLVSFILKSEDSGKQAAFSAAIEHYPILLKPQSFYELYFVCELEEIEQYLEAVMRKGLSPFFYAEAEQPYILPYLLRFEQGATRHIEMLKAIFRVLPKLSKAKAEVQLKLFNDDTYRQCRLFADKVALVMDDELLQLVINTKYGIGFNFENKKLFRSFYDAVLKESIKTIDYLIDHGAIKGDENVIFAMIQLKQYLQLTALLEKLSEQSSKQLRANYFNNELLMKACTVLSSTFSPEAPQWQEVLFAFNPAELEQALGIYLLTLGKLVFENIYSIIYVAPKLQELYDYHNNKDGAVSLKQQLAEKSDAEVCLVEFLHHAVTLRIKGAQYHQTQQHDLTINDCIGLENQNDQPATLKQIYFLFNVGEQDKAFMSAISILLELAVDLNKKCEVNNIYYPPVLLACFFDNKQLLETMLAKGAVVPPDAFSICVKFNFKEAMSALLTTKEIDIFARSLEGFNALDYAVQRNDEQLLRDLLDYAHANYDLSYIRQRIYPSCLLIKKDETKQEIMDLLFNLLPAEANFHHKKQKLAQEGSQYTISSEKISAKQFNTEKSRYKFFKFHDNGKEFIAKIHAKDWREMNNATYQQTGKIISRLSNNTTFLGPRIKRLKDGAYKIRPNGNKRLILRPDPNAEQDNMLIGQFELKHNK